MPDTVLRSKRWFFTHDGMTSPLRGVNDEMTMTVRQTPGAPWCHGGAAAVIKAQRDHFVIPRRRANRHRLERESV
ncbi:MAG: hypothetical protein Q4G70_02680 [Pseudomonadota bacterium]|nr:hypothetical protein [Pseudomonadota bacterium]